MEGFLEEVALSSGQESEQDWSVLCPASVMRMTCGPWFRTLTTILEVSGLGKNGTWPSFLKSPVLKLLSPELALK